MLNPFCSTDYFSPLQSSVPFYLALLCTLRSLSTMTHTVSHHPQMGPSSCRKTSSGLPLILHYGELYNYFIIYYNVKIIEIKYTINVMCLSHPETIPCPAPGLWKNYLPRNRSLVPKRLGTAALEQGLVSFFL